MRTHREVLEHMARELLECETMDADHLKRILDAHKTSPQLSLGTQSKHPAEHLEIRPVDMDIDHREASG
jgi:hypothetical protein